MRNRTWGVVAGAVAAVGVGLVVLASCSPDDEPGPGATSTAGASSSTGGDTWTRAELQELVFEGDVGTSSVLGSVSGEIPSRPTPFPAEIEVTEVSAGSESTLVRFTLRNDGEEVSPSLESFNRRTPLTKDIRDIAIVDTTLGARLQPFLGVQASAPDVSMCTCADAPKQVTDAGQLLSGTFPPLDPGTTTITVEIPGFPPVEDVPVTRR
ncbi:hypothetical protein [Cellulomonas sp. NS3]|uniref:hypothetical protein n=1 Tax=Cellulomonas sp. NS3 TaxID=2973977 RepID=UPI00216342A2|nr:hypothetical protein [Cellulomonas sp. NS3]